MKRLNFIGRVFVFPLFTMSALSAIAKGHVADGAAVVDVDAMKQITIDIRQRDSAEGRAKAIERVRTMLAADAAAQVTALTVLSRTADIKFDRDGLEPKVAVLLWSPSEEVRRCALTALPTLNPQVGRIDDVAKLARDPDPGVRAAVAQSIIAIRRSARIDEPVHEPVLTLLGDADEKVVVATAHSLWGVPLSEEVERKIVRLSQFEGAGVARSVAYDMHYYVLSTRPIISRLVAERLAEIARHPELDQNWTGRAIWGLANACTPDAEDVITRALIEELDNSLVPYNREWAVRGLIRVRTEAARKKLAEIAAKDDSDELRRMAASAIARRST